MAIARKRMASGVRELGCQAMAVTAGSMSTTGVKRMPGRPNVSSTQAAASPTTCPAMASWMNLSIDLVVWPSLAGWLAGPVTGSQPEIAAYGVAGLGDDPGVVEQFMYRDGGAAGEPMPRADHRHPGNVVDLLDAQAVVGDGRHDERDVDLPAVESSGRIAEGVLGEF